MELTTFKILVSVVLIGVFSLVLRLYRAVILEPKRLRSVLKRQGIDGPPPTFLLGNAKDIKKTRSTTQQSSVSSLSHNYLFASLFPSFQEWRAKYGQIFVFALGNTQILFVNEPDAVKEINKCTSLELGKPTYQQKLRSSLLGQGIISSNGKVWAHQRKILAPEFYMNKVQGMINHITKSTITLLDSWKNRTFKEGGVVDIKIDEDMRIFSRDVISRACFGSNFDKGQEIFNKLRALEDVMSRKSLAIGIPGLRYLPTKNKREEQALKKEVRNLILQVVKQRMEVGYEKDLLQMVLESAKNSNFNEEVANSFIVDNCKNIYLAGSQTTAVSANWCLMLLAANQEWQERVRAEVFEICGGQMPDADMLRQMKQLTMVIQETLRLYPVIPVVSREVFKDMKFGEICVPKGVNIWIMMLTLHTDPEIWGPDAHEFKPQRFTNGISGACRLPHLYMPFGVGPRVCLGQNLAMVELKILVALILTKFSISLSPNYVHKPAMRLIIEPEHGVDLLVKDL